MAGELERRKPEASKALVPATAPQSTASLVGAALGDAVEVLQAHVQLAVVEVKEDARAVARVAVGFAFGAVLGVLAVAFLGAGAAFALDIWLATWIAFSIVGIVIAIGAAIAIAVARRKLAAHDFTPERTIEMLQENRQWLADRTSAKRS